ncbi:MAG: DUF5050 domain-containing protein [Nitrososphaerota archaeon]|nr:DUF5050 domain-containing protein [Nitrososphaerota archaeon]
MKKISLLVIFFMFYLASGRNNFNISPINTKTPSDETQISMAFIHEDSEYIYVCNHNTLVRFSQDLTKRETIYHLKDTQEKFYVDSFLLIDENTLAIRLMDYPVTPIIQFISVNLVDGTSRLLYEEDENYRYSVPTKIDDSIYYFKWATSDFHANDASIIKRAKNGSEIEILKNIRVGGFSGDSIYYLPTDGKAIYKCDFDGNNGEKLFETDNIKAFRVYDKKIFYDLGFDNKNFAYDIEKKKTDKISLDFWLGSAQFCKGFMYVQAEGGKSYRINTSIYEWEDFKLDKSFEKIGDLTYERYTQKHVYYQRIIYGENKVEKIEIYRQNLDNGAMERVL